MVLLGGAFVIPPISKADDRTIDADYVLEMDLDDLMKAEITSVSRYGKLILDAPAAITVIDSEQIKNSGLRELPEILRLVPGLQIQRTNAHYWYISSRELPDMGWGKLLILIDGRTVYSEDIGETLWEAQSITLEDIERIEVIRGPGGTLWGYNTVNGVVNIITKSARDTLGSLVNTGIADNGSYFTQLRQGLQLSRRTHMRLYYNQSKIESFETENGQDAGDGFKRRRGGFKIAYDPRETSELTLAAETSKFIGGDGDVEMDSTYKINQSYIQTKWIETISRDLNFGLQLYWDKEDYTGGETSAGKIFGTTVQNLDGEFQIDWRCHRRHRLMLGGGFRHSYFEIQSGYNPDLYYGFYFEDERADWQAFNLFMNDEIALIPNQVWLTLGAKLEHNQKTAWGWQPNIRMLYKPATNQSLWASVARALKRPTFENTASFQFVYDWPYIDYYIGEPLEDEDLTAYEFGYRNQVSPALSFDLAAFHNRHKHILMWDYRPISEFSYEYYNNYETSAKAYGGELSVNWHISDQLNVKGSYAYFKTDYNVLDEWVEDRLEDAERYMVQLHLNYSPISAVDTAVNAYYNDETTYDITRIPEYLRLDLLLHWRISAIFEASLVGQNLLDDSHCEYPDYEWDNIEIPRSVYLSLKARF